MRYISRNTKNYSCWNIQLPAKPKTYTSQHHRSHIIKTQQVIAAPIDANTNAMVVTIASTDPLGRDAMNSNAANTAKARIINYINRAIQNYSALHNRTMPSS